MEEANNLCENCQHFRQHYVHHANRYYIPTNCGHCTHPRLREKKPDTPACHRFAKKRTKSTLGEDR